MKNAKNPWNKNVVILWCKCLLLRRRRLKDFCFAGIDWLKIDPLHEIATEQVLPPLLRDTGPFCDVILLLQLQNCPLLQPFWILAVHSQWAVELQGGQVWRHDWPALCCGSVTWAQQPLRPLRCSANGERALLQHFRPLYKQLVVAGSVFSPTRRQRNPHLKAWKWEFLSIFLCWNHI